MDLPGDFRLESPWFLLLLLLIPLLALIRGRAGRGPSVRFSGGSALRKIGKPVRPNAAWPAAILLGTTLLLGTIALARPQAIKTTESVKASGVEIIIAIDVSLSMAIEDFVLDGRRANRLAQVKKVTRQFVEGRTTDRIGLVAFAGRPYVPSPLTLDHRWVLNSLDRLRLGLVEDGTAIGSAVAAAARRLDGEEAKSKVIVLITDGANNSGDLSPTTAAQLARTLGIRIYTIAVGTPGHHRIPYPGSPGQYIASMNQEFDVETLEEISKIGDGLFFRARDNSALEEIFAQIDELEKTEIETKKIVHATDLFPWFVGGALAFAFLHAVVARLHPSPA